MLVRWFDFNENDDKTWVEQRSVAGKSSWYFMISHTAQVRKPENKKYSTSFPKYKYLYDTVFIEHCNIWSIDAMKERSTLMDIYSYCVKKSFHDVEHNLIL